MLTHLFNSSCAHQPLHSFPTRRSSDLRVFLFTLLVAVLTALIVSVLPVLQLGTADPATSLRAGGRDAPARLGRSIWESGLVVTQVALSAVLVAAALLLARSFHNIRDADPGFQV